MCTAFLWLYIARKAASGGRLGLRLGPTDTDRHHFSFANVCFSITISPNCWVSILEWADCTLERLTTVRINFYWFENQMVGVKMHTCQMTAGAVALHVSSWREEIYIGVNGQSIASHRDMKGYLLHRYHTLKAVTSQLIKGDGMSQPSAWQQALYPVEEK